MLEAWKEIETEIGSKTFRGSYRYANQMVTVRTLNGSKTTQVGGLIPEYLAKILLRQLAQEETAGSRAGKSNGAGLISVIDRDGLRANRVRG